MKHTSILIACLLFGVQAIAQFPPPAGQPGTTAMAADSSAFVAWATACTVLRGPQDISNTGLGLASVGDETSAVGPAGSNGVVSLGDGGVAILTFAEPITNGPGWDFAVFENSFSDTFLELAFVEVSSNGVDYFRFPATSNTQVTSQVGGFGSVDATQIDNLAGKYRGGYGTPFDLEALVDQQGLDVNAVTHVKVIDVVGCIQDAYATYDHLGQKVNDPWNTPFASSGFDLDAVGVIHQISTGIADRGTSTTRMTIFPNPINANSRLHYTLDHATRVRISLCDASGRTVVVLADELRPAGVHTVPVDASGLAPGIYFVSLASEQGRTTERVIIDHAQ
jgi:hypothetical protein